MPSGNKKSVWENLLALVAELRDKPAGNKVFYAVWLFVALNLLGSVGYYLFGVYYGRGWTYLNCLYMTVTSLAAVGYGEILHMEHLPAVRLFTIFLIYGGAAVALFFASNLTAFFIDAQLHKRGFDGEGETPTAQREAESLWDRIIISLDALRDKNFKKLIISASIFAGLNVFGALGYYLFGVYYGQNWTFLNCLYMTVTSLTMIGYGEITPMESFPAARLYTIFLIYAGMAVILIFLSNLTAFLLDRQIRKRLNRSRKRSYSVKKENESLWDRFVFSLDSLRDKTIQKLIFSLGLFLVTNLIGGVGYYIFGLYYNQNWSFLNCLYMTVITLTTVGYGEITPLDNLPIVRIYTIIMLYSGMGIILFFVSNLTAFFVEGQLQKLMWRRKMQRKIEELKDHIIVCGAGETGSSIIEELHNTKRDFVAIDLSEERLNKLVEVYGEFPFIVGDAAEDEILFAAGLDRAKGIIASLANDKDNLVITVTSRQNNPKIRIVAKAVARGFDDKLRRSGANAVVTPNRTGGMRMASEMVRPSVVTFLDQMLRLKDTPMRFEDIEIDEKNKGVGKSIGEITRKYRSNFSVVALFDRNKRSYAYNPPEETKITAGDVLICLGEVKAIEALRAELSE